MTAKRAMSVSALMLYLAVVVEAGEPAKLVNRGTAALVCHGEELAKLAGSHSALFVRVVRAPEPGECSAEEDVCPPVHLLVGVTDSAGDAGELSAFAFPPAQDWAFVRWNVYPRSFDDHAELVLTRRRLLASKQAVLEEVVLQIGFARAEIVSVGPSRPAQPRQ